jgi:hypothetical protein
MAFKTTLLFSQLDKKGYKNFLISPKPADFQPDSAAFIIDGENRIICSYNPNSEEWDFFDGRPSPHDANSSPYDKGTTTEADIAMLCLDHGFGISYSPKKQMVNK